MGNLCRTTVSRVRSVGLVVLPIDWRLSGLVLMRTLVVATIVLKRAEGEVAEIIVLGLSVVGMEIEVVGGGTVDLICCRCGWVSG